MFVFLYCVCYYLAGSMDMVETGIDQKLMYGGDGTDGEDGKVTFFCV